MPGLGISMGRGGATTFSMDMQFADAIMIMGSNMAECHPVAFRWVMKARTKGAQLIHVDVTHPGQAGVQLPGDRRLTGPRWAAEPQHG